MKGFQWTKLAHNKVKGSIFEGLPLGRQSAKFFLKSLDYKGLNIDYKELEENFSMKAVEKKEKGYILRIFSNRDSHDK